MKTTAKGWTGWMSGLALLLVTGAAVANQNPTATDPDETSEPTLEPQPANLYRAGAVAWAVNVGGGEHLSRDGVLFEMDALPTELSSGRMVDDGQPAAIKGTTDPVVYQSYREGELVIHKPLPNGVYDLTLLFAEPHDVAPGERLFNVLVQGRTVVRALDVRQARDGNSKAALTRTVTGLQVEDGQLQLELQAITGLPLLNGLLLRSREPDRRNWELVWNDEFDYAGPPDPARWNIQQWDARQVNDEDQAYTDRPRNVRVSDGRLVLEAHRERWRNAAYTSGRIHSLGKGDWLYGRIDVRARLPAGQGTWPALWMLPSDPFRYATLCSEGVEWQGNADCDAWPNSGEIDIMEHVGYDMTRLHGTVHNRAWFWVNQEQRKGSVEVSGLDQAFHIYSLEWTPELIRIYFEGVPYFVYHNEGEGWQSWPYDHPYHLIMNLAIGGGWGRAGGPIDDSIFPVRLEVDYVRVFRAPQ